MRPNSSVMKRKNPRVATAALVLFCLAAGLGVAGVAAQEASISVSAEADDTVSAGGQVTLDVTAQDTGFITVSNVPSSWSVSSSQNQGAFVAPDGPGNEIQSSGTVLWAWADDRPSSEVSVTFAVPEDSQPGDVSLNIDVENGDGDTASDTVTVTVEGDGEDVGGGEGGTEDGAEEEGTDEGGSEEGTEDGTGGGDTGEGTDGSDGTGTDGGGEDNEGAGDDTEDTEGGSDEDAGETANEDGNGEGADGGTDAGDDDGEGLPGFGALAALVALVCYAYAARRSQS